MSAQTSVGIEIVATVDKAVSMVKTGANKISGFLLDIQKKKVNLNEVITKAFSPALILGEMASMFGALTLMTAKFDADVQEVLVGSSNEFTKFAEENKKRAIAIALSTGSSAAGNVSTLSMLSKTWKDVSMQETIAAASAKLSAAGMGDQLKIATLLSDVLKRFGVNDVETAKVSIQELYTAQRNSTLGFDEFVTTLLNAAPVLRSQNISIRSAADNLSALSTQSGMTSDAAVSAFNEMIKMIDKTDIGMYALANATVPGLTKALTSSDLTAALTSIETYFNNGGTAARAIGSQLGVSSDSMNTFASLTKTEISEIKTKVQELIDKQKELGTSLDVPTTAALELKQEWENVKTKMLELFASDAGLKFFKTLLDNALLLLEALGKIVGYFTKIILKVKELNDEQTDALADNYRKVERDMQDFNQTQLLLGKQGLRLTNPGVGAIDSLSKNDQLDDLLRLLESRGTYNDINNVYSSLNLGSLNVSSNANGEELAGVIVNALKNSMYSTTK